MIEYPGNGPNAKIPPPNRQSFSNPIPNYGTLSPSGARQTRLIGVPMFNFSLTYEKLEIEEVRCLESFFLQQGGPNVAFSYKDVLRSTPYGVPEASAPIINGAGQTGNVLNSSNWEPSISGLLLPGDIFTIANDLKVYTVIESIDSDFAGDAIINFEPSLIETPLNLSIITIQDILFNCKFVSSGLLFQTYYPYFHSVSIRFIETLA